MCEGASAFCEKCSAKHMPMFENADKLQSIADRFGVYLGIVQNIVQSGLDRDLSLEACLVGARLALSMESGKEELFSLDDIAAVLGCSREEAATEFSSGSGKLVFARQREFEPQISQVLKNSYATFPAP